MSSQTTSEIISMRLLDVLEKVTSTLDKVIDIIPNICANNDYCDGESCEEGQAPYLVKPDSDLYPCLRMQLDAIPKSRMDALSDYPREVQARIIQRIAKLHKSTEYGRSNIDKYKDLIARINEKHDLDLMVVSARGEYDIIVLVDRPSKSVFFLYKGLDPSDGEYEEAFIDIEMDISDPVFVPGRELGGDY